MANKYIVKTADRYQKSHSEIEKIFKDTQLYLVKVPPYQFLAEEAQRFKTMPTAWQLAWSIAKNHPQYQIIPKFKVRRINEHLYPQLDKKHLLNLINNFPATAAPFEIAKQIARTKIGVILVENLDLFEKTSILLYPELSIEDFDLVFSEYPVITEADEVANLIQERTKKYINRCKILVLSEIKKQLHPSSSEEEIIRVMNEYPKLQDASRLAQLTAERSEEFITTDQKRIYEMVCGLVYPRLDIPTFAKLLNHFETIKTPRTYAERLCEENKEYLLISFCAEIQSQLYPELGFDEIQEYQSLYPDAQDALSLAKEIAENSRNLIWNFDQPLFEQVRNLVHPQISISQYKSIRGQLTRDQDPAQIADEIINKNPDHLLKSDWENFIRTGKLLYPELSIKIFNRYAESNLLPTEIAAAVSNQEQTYVLKTQVEFISKRLYPSPDVEFIYRILSQHPGQINPEQIISLILEEHGNEYIPGEYSEVCETVQDLLYPAPYLSDIYTVINKSETKEIASLIDQLIDYFLCDPSRDYILKKDHSFLKAVRGKLHPKPDKDTLLSIRDELGHEDPAETINYLLDEFPQKYILKEHRKRCSAARDLLFPKIKLPLIFQELRQSQAMDPARLAEAVAAKHEDVFLSQAVEFELQVRALLFPEPDLALIIQERNKYDYLIHPDEVAKKIAQKYPKYSIVRDRLGSVGWYDD